MPDTAFFRPELFEFLRQLRRHNDRDWFAKNKARYEEFVRDPALLFIGSFAPHLAKLSPVFVADARPARGSLFRIYRDTRFSPDKRPFKNMSESASRTPAARMRMRLSSTCIWRENCFAAAGVWHPDSRTLTRIRTAIVNQPEWWAKVRRKLELGGDSLTRPPRGYNPKHPFIGDIKRKDFVAPQLHSRISRSVARRSCGISPLHAGR